METNFLSNKDFSSDEEDIRLIKAFEDLGKDILKEEKNNYHNDLVPFQQHEEQEIIKFHELGKNYGSRIKRGLSLLKERFKNDL